METDNGRINLKIVHLADMLPNFWSSKFTWRWGLVGLNWWLEFGGNEFGSDIFDEMVAGNLMKEIGWHERILRWDSSIFPIDEEGFEEIEEVGTDDGIEIGAV